MTAEEKEYMKTGPYVSAVGSLMYVMLCTRPNICFSVGIVSRYQSNPSREHWTAVKHILKYLRRTRDYMLVYHGDELAPIGYNDFMELGVIAKAVDPMILYFDNSGVVAQPKEQRNHRKGKHIERKYHLV